MDASGIALSVIVLQSSVRSVVSMERIFEKINAGALRKVQYGIYSHGGMQ